ncbi:MAG: RNA 2'-phosphotransferase [Deltaproteobacteria bacterium]|nr:RNA 2'-phosphotransferase [Deltaproteobacteria bacterium]
MNRKPGRLNKFLEYVLGRRPDEFGLVPDEDGWVRVKDLLAALSEEQGYKYVRRSHINEVILSVPDAGLEMDDNRVRARVRQPASDGREPPTLLYVCVRKKAYPRVLEHGLAAAPERPLVLAVTPEMALRMGKRRDPDPVLLTVNTAQAGDHGVVFTPRGELLFTADSLPPGTFSGPAPPKAPEPSKKKPEKKPSRPEKREWGSVFPDASALYGPDPMEKKGRKKKSWKEQTRRDRRRRMRDED